MRSPLDINKAVVVKCHKNIGNVVDALFDKVNVLGKLISARVKNRSPKF